MKGIEWRGTYRANWSVLSAQRRLATSTNGTSDEKDRPRDGRWYIRNVCWSGQQQTEHGTRPLVWWGTWDVQACHWAWLLSIGWRHNQVQEYTYLTFYLLVLQLRVCKKRFRNTVNSLLNGSGNPVPPQSGEEALGTEVHRTMHLHGVSLSPIRIPTHPNILGRCWCVWLKEGFDCTSQHKIRSEASCSLIVLPSHGNTSIWPASLLK